MEQARQEDFEAQREVGRSLAYRMLGAAADVEDIMQEAWLRWDRYDGEIQQPRSFMLSVVSRLCLDWMGSARVRRERYVGPWLPEPVSWAGSPSPESHAVWRESITVAFLHILERLSPRERLVFLLRRVFELEHAQIADELGMSPAACRQLYVRACKHFEEERGDASPREQVSEALIGRVFAAMASGDVDALRAALHPEVIVLSDGGGLVSAATRPVHGADACAKLLIGIARRTPPGFAMELREVNGALSVVMSAGDVLYGITTLEVIAGRVFRVYTQVNPDKIGALAGAAVW
jgi:RNA polymerase sigma-70 factor, ECF subfamily